MKKRALRLSAGLVLGIAMLIGGAWALSKSLATPENRYHGQPATYWVMQLNGTDASASNAAMAVLNSEIIPSLTNVMFHDLRDPPYKLRLINFLNGLPGIEVAFQPADVRRKAAAYELGEYGPAGRNAVTALLQALISDDDAVRETAARSLGSIGADPQTVIPALTQCLSDDDVNVRAATALSTYGPQAKPAVPELVKMWQRGDGEAKVAAGGALRIIDADAYAEMIRASRVKTIQPVPTAAGGSAAPAGK